MIPLTTMPEGHITKKEARQADRCHTCGKPFGALPFCEKDGTVREPFLLAGRYEVLRLIGAGGMAFVFEARHKTLGKQVAVKVLRSDGQVDEKRFVREARLASQLEHENVVGTLDFGTEESLGLNYFVMELLRGRALHAVMREQGALPPKRVLPILSQLARALVAAHDKGIVHRDLTPKNVMLTESSGRRDVVKLCDFGVSRSLEGDTRITSTGQVLGTPAYMAPEQIHGEETITSAADVYAFGTVAFEMLTGKLPVQGRSAVAVIANKLHAPPVRFAEHLAEDTLPAEVEAILSRCLRPEAGERPNAAELEVALASPQAASGPDALPANLVGSTVGNYRLDALLGSGGMGSVYRGVNPRIGTNVAIKVLHREVASDADSVERFIREAKAATAIGSPYIPRYFDFGELSDGRTYAVMDYVEGESMADRLARSGPIPLSEAKGLIAQCAHALAAAHASGVVHRDVKPDNVLVTKASGDVRILDFGIAKVAAQSGAKTTRAGAFLGSPSYCAPEQVYGGTPSPQMDLYALACTAYEAITGQDVFTADSVEQLLRMKSAGEVPRLAEQAPGLPPAVIATLQKALAWRPEHRHATLQDFAAEVSAWPTNYQPEESQTAPYEDTRELTPPPLDVLPNRRRWVGYAAAAIVLASLGAVGVLLSDDPEPVAPPAPSAAAPSTSSADREIEAPIAPEVAQPSEPAPSAAADDAPVGDENAPVDEAAAAVAPPAPVTMRRRRRPPSRPAMPEPMEVVLGPNASELGSAAAAEPAPAPASAMAAPASPMARTPSAMIADPFNE
ncbi:MAG: serine/threonine-protein kinase [Myxococcota bacterium]